jgi:hypothetical protein
MLPGEGQDIALESEQAMSLLILGDDSGGEGGGRRAKVEQGSRTDPFPGAEEDPPFPGLGFFEEEDLHGATTIHFSTSEPGGDDLGVVEDEEIARLEPLPEVGEGGVIAAVGVTFEDEQAGGIPLRSRVLGDQLGGKMKVEIGDQHSGPRRA